jgi:hypothetical protein
MSNVIHLNIVPKATAYDQGEDPATALLKAIDRCEKRYGERVTAVVIARRYQIADSIADTFNWRERHRKAFFSGDKS